MSTIALATFLALAAPNWLPAGARWDANDFPIPYCVSINATRTDASSEALGAAVSQAVLSWVSESGGGGLSCSTYTAIPDQQQCAPIIDLGDQQPNIFWEASNWVHGSQTLGVTHSNTLGNSCGSVTDDKGMTSNLPCKLDSDIELNDVSAFWTVGEDAASTDVQSIVAHEYGHFIGLDHCNKNDTCGLGSGVMNAFYPRGGLVRTPLSDDTEGACALYPGIQGNTGWPCESNGACNATRCENPGEIGYCSETCADGTGCPTNFSCETDPENAAQKICSREDGLGKGLCERCVAPGFPNACKEDGFCAAGLPTPDEGRCVTPCPNPGAQAGGCPANYECSAIEFQNGAEESYCFPVSQNCEDPGSTAPLLLGQSCDGEPACDGGLVCLGICTSRCGEGTPCPADWACQVFDAANSFCLPEADEGESCEGLTQCTSGPCLTAGGGGSATCYQDCAPEAGACNNAQKCETIELSANDQVSICTPPGAPPVSGSSDAGVPDAALGLDSGVSGADAGVGEADAGTGNSCLCDVTINCEPGCRCDPSCSEGAEDGGCHHTQTRHAPPEATVAVLLLLSLFLLRQRRRRTSDSFREG